MVPEGLEQAYKEAIEAEHKHKQIAQAMIAAAVGVIKSKDIDVDGLVKATASLDKGTRMQTRANEQIIKLLRNKPQARK